MNIAGIQRFSAIDYPDKLACVLFTAGCNFCCPYCHNPELLSGKVPEGFIYEEDILAFLNKRQGKLGGVVISGGEPTLQADLIEFCKKIKEFKYAIKVDTNGGRSHAIYKLISNHLLDMVGLDIKAPWSKYKLFVKDKNLSEPYIASIKTTIEYCFHDNIPIDIRTTIHKSILTQEDLRSMRDQLVALGITRWYIQQYNAVDVLDKTLNEQPTYSDQELITLAQEMSNDKIKVITRGLTSVKYVHD